MKHLSIMVKPSSSLCNMRCAYCFYRDVSESRQQPSMGMMSHETAGRLVNSVYESLENGDHVTFAFQGGEPLMTGISFYVHFVQLVKAQTKRVSVHYAMQTNGLAIDAEWCTFFKRHQFLVGLSMDGPAKYHDANRLDVHGEGTYHRLIGVKKLLEQHHVDYNILTVLTNTAARHPQEMWSFILRGNIQYIQFIPCLGSLDAQTASPYALTPKRFASFYSTLFRLWLEEWKRGRYVSVKLFDDLIALLGRSELSACGILGQCQPQFVVEADGSAYLCDFYCTDEYLLGNMTEQTPETLFFTEAMQAFLAHRGPQNPLCLKCPHQRFCGGNCKRQRASMCWGSPADSTCGYRTFLDECLPDLLRASRR